MLRAPKRLYKLLNDDFKRTFLRKFVEKIEPRVEKAIDDKNNGDDKWRRTMTPMLRETMQNSLRGYHPSNEDQKFDTADKLSTLIDLGLLIADADDAYWNIFVYAWNEVQDSTIELEPNNLYLTDHETSSQTQREVRKKKKGREPDYENIKTGRAQYDYSEDELQDDYE